MRLIAALVAALMLLLGQFPHIAEGAGGCPPTQVLVEPYACVDKHYIGEGPAFNVQPSSPVGAAKVVLTCPAERNVPAPSGGTPGYGISNILTFSAPKIKVIAVTDYNYWQIWKKAATAPADALYTYVDAFLSSGSTDGAGNPSPVGWYTRDYIGGIDPTTGGSDGINYLWKVEGYGRRATTNTDNAIQFSDLTVEFECAADSGLSFHPVSPGASSYACMLTPLPVTPATTCEYAASVGFNPWERWNVITHRESNNLFIETTVEGRVAGGSLTILSSAIHTVAEPFIKPTKGSTWSITSINNVVLSLSSSVRGSIEAGGVIDDDSSGNTVGGDRAQSRGQGANPPLSVDLDAAFEYFDERSEAWAAEDNSYISKEFNHDKSELTVRLHGKVNFVKDVTFEEVSALTAIHLAGNPRGTVIFNIPGTGTIRIPPQLAQLDRAGQSSALTSGRVLFNFFEPGTITIEALTSLPVSILAPKSELTFNKAHFSGNVVALTLTATGTYFGILPFGTPPRLLVPPENAPPRKTFTSAGRLATACLWHQL